MKDNTRKKLDEFLDFMDSQFKATDVPPRTLEDRVGKAYMVELNQLNETEAIEYLKSVPEEKIVEAYLVLSRRLDSSTLVQICLQYIEHPTFHSRLVGAGELGPLLLGTYDIKASRALARLIRNPAVEDGIRELAYRSLTAINSRANLDDVLDRIRSRRASVISGRGIENIDWNFVDSFGEEN